MQEYTVEKSTMERYNIILKGGNDCRCAWAIISISDDGIFNAQTDCGDFSYIWNSFGNCFKSFLIDLCSNDTEYLYKKICDSEREKRVDMEKTIKNMKSRIIQKRMEEGRRHLYGREDFTPDEARELWDELDLLDHRETSKDSFIYLFNYEISSDLRTKVFSDEICYDNLIVNSSDRSAKAFCEVIAPIFAETLKSELQKNVINE